MRVTVAAEQLRRQVPGGIGTYARGLLRGLASTSTTDLAVTVRCSRAPKGPDPLTTLGWPVDPSPFGHRLLTQLWDRGILREGRHSDVLHSVSLAAPRPRSRATKTSIMVADLSWRDHPEATSPRGQRWHEAALQRAIASNARLVVLSGAVRDALVVAGVEDERIVEVRLGLDHLVTADPTLARAQLKAKGVTGPFLLSVSTLEPRKNLERLIAAHSAARHLSGDVPPLVIVGPSGWGPELTSGDHDDVVLFGSAMSSVLTALYDLAAGFVYVPLTEGYGLPPLEAISRGCAVLGSISVPALTEFDVKGADLVDPRSVDAIAEGLLRLSAGATGVDRKLAAQTAATHTWARCARDHLDMWATP